jgi:hypothetical protein
VLLNTNQIHAIAAHFNPDGAGSPAAWLTVTSYNNWEEAFDTSLTDPTMKGIVHIFVVNNAIVDVPSDEEVGEHWIFVAWYVDPDE